jgi:hypothetical protein
VKRRVVTAVVVLVLLTAGVLLGRRFVERVPVTIRRGASLEVRRQPRLAFERMLIAGKADVRRVALADGTAALPASAVLLLDESTADLSRGLGDALLDWVARGGTLVLSPGAHEADAPLSARLGVRRYEPRDSLERHVLPRITVTLPGTRTRFAVAPVDGFLLDTPPAWSQGDGRGGLALALLPRGRGRVLIAADLATMWSNDGIGVDDHAALLWGLATIGGPGTPVVLTEAAAPAFTWRAVVGRGWPVVTAGVVLGLLALWRVLPRLGPVSTPPRPERRQLREHLQALGRFQLTRARYDALAAGAQRALDQQLRRQPWQRRSDDVATLAARPATPTQFLSTIQRLHALWRRLHRA